jgi:hypothetical protein
MKSKLEKKKIIRKFASLFIYNSIFLVFSILDLDLNRRTDVVLLYVISMRDLNIQKNDSFVDNRRQHH